MKTLKHFGNLRLLEAKSSFKKIDQAVAASLDMIEAGSKTSTYQIFSRDIFISKDLHSNEFKVARPIVGYLTQNDVYKTSDLQSGEYESALWEGEDFDACALEFEEFGSQNARIRLEFESGACKTYFERLQVN